MSTRKINAFQAPIPLRKAPPNSLNSRKPSLNTNYGSPFSPKRILDDGNGNSFRIDTLSQFMAKGKADKVKVNQKRITQQDTTSTPEASSSTTSSTSPQTTSSSARATSTKPNTTSNNNSMRERSNSGRPNYGGNNRDGNFSFNKDEVKEGKEFRGVDTSLFIGNLYGSGITSPVTYSMNLQNVMFMNDFETSDNSSSESRIKLIIKGTSFSAQFIETNYTDYVTSITNLFKKFDVDVANKLNSYTSSGWDRDAFKDAMYWISKGLETYYALDSILSYNAGSMGGYTVNRCYESYRNVVASDVNLLNARNKLRTALRGMWFPPNFSSMIRWFYQTYKVSNLDQSPIFRFVPDSSLYLSSTSDDTLAGTLDVTSILNALSVRTNAAKISSILKNVYPQGVIGILPGSCSDAVYDERMSEIFVNDCVVWSDVLNTNTVSYYPISYSATNNDIPYYMATNPTERTNGLAFALQCIPIHTTATSGYLKSYIYGLRTPVTFNMKDQDSISDVSNFQIVTQNSTSGKLRGYCKPNNQATTYKSIDQFNAHNRTYYYAQNTNTSVMRLTSGAVNNYQRVYFNNGNAPKLIIGEFINSLFQTKA